MESGKITSFLHLGQLRLVLRSFIMSSFSARKSSTTPFFSSASSWRFSRGISSASASSLSSFIFSSIFLISLSRALTSGSSEGSNSGSSFGTSFFSGLLLPFFLSFLPFRPLLGLSSFSSSSSSSSTGFFRFLLSLDGLLLPLPLEGLLFFSLGSTSSSSTFSSSSGSSSSIGFFLPLFRSWERFLSGLFLEERSSFLPDLFFASAPLGLPPFRPFFPGE